MTQNNDQSVAESLRTNRTPAEETVMVRIPISMWRSIQTRGKAAGRTGSAELRMGMQWWLDHGVQETLTIVEEL